MDTRVDQQLICGINRLLLPVKGVYFFFIAAVGDLLPFIPVYMKQLGLSSTETGIIYGVMPFLSFFVRPVFGAVADKFHKHKLILCLCCILTGLFYGLLLVTPTKGDSEQHLSSPIQFQCNPVDSFLRDCTRAMGNSSDVSKKCPMSFLDVIMLYESSNNTKEMACSINCKNEFSLAPDLSICFTNSTTQFDDYACKTLINSSGSNQFFTFSVKNIEVPFSLIIGGKTDSDGVVCKDFNLKKVVYKENDFYRILCSEEALLDCTVQCNHIKEMKPECNFLAKATLSTTFWVFLVIYLLANIVSSPAFSLMDAFAYDILGEKRGLWGRQRLWGTIGFALFAVTSTFIMDHLSKTSTHIDYSLSFYIFIGLMIFAAMTAFFLRVSENLVVQQMFKNISRLLKYPNVIVFLIILTCFGINNAVIEVFLFWYLKDLGSTQLNLGLCLVANCSVEVVMLFFAGHIIKKVGQTKCLYLALVAFAIRFFAHSFITNPWYALPVETLHGITFGLMYAAASSYGSIIAPPGMSATVQGLVGGVYFGLGKGIGSLVTGKLFDPKDGLLGQVWTFRFYGFVSLFILAIYLLYNVCFDKQRPDPKDARPERKLSDREVKYRLLLMGNQSFAVKPPSLLDPSPCGMYNTL
ncbi:hypothetical protein CHS0354_002120 [Potamilus streckersoni]|uniref:Major facilitator superfamily (MFS) profile domain-containing protein n=1 Tax=Potamilus streckersoni TaxID=2493646 RepID=A0AAE0TJR2_9BIVA|nr:hypothetical protein CHS0354_002120 [Potamilus streckersoni]